jgi:hypothetical protein
MSLIQDLYLNKKISSEEMSKLSEIRAGLLNAMECGHKRTVAFVAETFESCSEQEIEKLAEMAIIIESQLIEKAIQQYDEDTVQTALDWINFEKTAGAPLVPTPRPGDVSKLREISGFNRIWSRIPGPLKKIIPPAAAAAVLAALGLSLVHSAGQGLQMVTHPISEGVSRIRHGTQSKTILAEILKENPELKKDPKTIENFNLLLRYAPETVATNKPVAEAMLKKMQQWGHVDPQSLQQMIAMEGGHIKNVQDRTVFPRGLKPQIAGVQDWATIAGLG